MNLTNFTGIVDEYKQNFRHKEGKVLNVTKEIPKEKRKRENKIEQNKFFNMSKGALDPIKNQGGGFLDNIIKICSIHSYWFHNKKP